MHQNKVKHSKRLDLQGIRALAIIVVLGFHFFPEYCPNGYLGVDQFFVLSGFLMCMLLKRAENESSCSLVSLFYSKRFKRILPLYLLIIFISMICLYNFFPDTAVETNQNSAVRALLFISNRPKTDQEDYFQMLSIAIDIFTHTWSLSVEIQFYFLVPFIFLLATKIPEKFQYFYYGIIGLLSFLFYCLASPTVSFNSVFARIWQFLIGMVVYLMGTISQQQGLKAEEKESFVKLLEEGENEDNNKKETSQSRNFEFLFNVPSYIVLMFLISICLFPLVLPVLIIRPLVTIGTGILMLISENNQVLSNKVWTYIGDISYSLYLIHWPIYAYWKLTCKGDMFLLFCALCFSIVLAILTYEIFEKWYLRLSSTSIAVLVVLLIFSNVIAIYQNEIMGNIKSIGRNVTDLDRVTDDMTNDDAGIMNYRWNINDLKNLYAPTCEYEIRNTPYGEVSIGEDFSENVTTFDMDPIYQIMKKQMLKLIESIKYKLFIVHAIPSVMPNSISKIAGWMKNGIDPLVIQKQLLRPHGFEMARKRYEQLVKDCNGKCILIDYTPVFYNNSTKFYEYYDKKGFSYWTSDQHFSPHGIEHIRHVWTGICSKL